MWQDPIVAETRALRDEYARQFNYDADAIFEDLMAKQAMHPERVVSLSPRKVKPVVTVKRIAQGRRMG
ncbi:MAG: hypothetical protein WCI11_15135 [Candidatus Methylumidiphilus sp.]